MTSGFEIRSCSQVIFSQGKWDIIHRSIIMEYVFCTDSCHSPACVTWAHTHSITCISHCFRRRRRLSRISESSCLGLGVSWGHSQRRQCQQRVCPFPLVLLQLTGWKAWAWLLISRPHVCFCLSCDSHMCRQGQTLISQSVRQCLIT